MIIKFRNVSMKYLIITILTISFSNFADAKNNTESSGYICDAANINLCKKSSNKMLKIITDCMALNYKKYRSIKYKLLASSIYSNDSSCIKNLNDTGLLTKSDFNIPIIVGYNSPLRFKMPEYKYNVKRLDSPVYYDVFIPSLHLSSLGHAIYLNNVSMAKILVSMGASLDITTPVYKYVYATDGKPLTYFNIDLYGVAALLNNMEALQFLKNAGANINNTNALSPIFMTIFSASSSSSFEFLVNNGINVNNTAHGFDPSGYVKNDLPRDVYLEQNYSPLNYTTKMYEHSNRQIELIKKLLENPSHDHYENYKEALRKEEEEQKYYKYLIKKLQDAGATL